MSQSFDVLRGSGHLVRELGNISASIMVWVLWAYNQAPSGRWTRRLFYSAIILWIFGGFLVALAYVARLP